MSGLAEQRWSPAWILYPPAHFLLLSGIPYHTASLSLSSRVRSVFSPLQENSVTGCLRAQCGQKDNMSGLFPLTLCKPSYMCNLHVNVCERYMLHKHVCTLDLAWMCVCLCVFAHVCVWVLLYYPVCFASWFIFHGFSTLGVSPWQVITRHQRPICLYFKSAKCLIFFKGKSKVHPKIKKCGQYLLTFMLIES